MEVTPNNLKSKNIAAVVIALLSLGAAAYFTYRHIQKPAEQACSFCERRIHQGVAYRLAFGDGLRVACCPRCGMHYTREHPGAVEAAFATDFTSGKAIPARSGYYVEGGDAQYCTMHEAPVQRAPEGISIRAYDRCLPSLVAFRTLQEAEAYRRAHAGRVLTYDQALESVRTQSP